MKALKKSFEMAKTAEAAAKKRFQKRKDGNDIVDIVKLLFDNITSEQAVDLYRSKFSS
jgi:hypothetical protein